MTLQRHTPPKRAPAITDPSFTKTYRRADGDDIGSHAWVPDLEYFEGEEDPVELIEESWERTSADKFWHLPTAMFDCGAHGCDEDAVAWHQTTSGDWYQVCEEHRTSG